MSTMFSPSMSEGGPATATRSRRRQRPKSQESLVPPPKAKRQRIPLTEQTFVNPDVQPETTEAIKPTEKIATVEPKNDLIIEASQPQPVSRRESTLRVKKSKHADRAAQKGDGSLVLTSTNAYTVSKLPALPDRIRGDWSGNQQADVFSSSGYALTLTPTHAIVWPYNSISQSPETFTFTLPSSSKPNDTLPVGCLVSPSASSTDPGLVVVMASIGKVVFWESISSAATFAFIKKDRSGVEYMISGMSSGERVVAITNADATGFILTFNTGRLAYMTVRDSHGRPAISVQFLRSSLSGTTGGLFGSIRHAFSHLSLKGDIAAVRADRSSRVGEKNVVALTGKGKLQSWKVHRGGHSEAFGEFDIREDIISALKENDPFCSDFPVDSFEAIDFTFVPKGLESKYLNLSRLSNAMASEDPSVQQLLLLVSLTRRSVSRYALVEVILNPREFQIGMIRPITSYSTLSSQTESCQSPRPRLYLPRPALVAFVVFDRAAVIASVAISPDSPDSQLQTDTHTLPPSFEDVVDFREDNVHEVVGSGFEEPSSASLNEESRAIRHKSKNPAVVLLVRGAGMVRIATTDVDKFASDQPPQVSAKSKLEQAVFFGTKKNNPLVFDARQEIQFSKEEISQAALEISHEILSSTTSYILTLPASLEDNLLARSAALEKLMSHLKVIEADLDRKTRWSLLYNAEKMHVATLLWKRQEHFTSARPADDKKSLIGNIVEFIHEDQKSLPSPEAGEVDQIRHWFINDVFRLELFVAWAYEVIKILYRDKLLDDAKVTTMIYEALQINICTLIGALDFRRNHLSAYGLGDEKLRLGILREGYEGLPEPWTGCHYIANNLARLVELSDQWYQKWSRQSKPDDKTKATAKPDAATIARIYKDLPAAIDAMLTSMLEYSRWAETTPDQRTTGQNFANEYLKARYSRPIALGRSGKWDEGTIIAEKHGCLDGLAVILLDHIEELEGMLGEEGLTMFDKQNLKVMKDKKTSELEDRFSRYGQEFTFAMYEYMIEKRGVEAVMRFEVETLGYKTRFLRSRPELARISWINDVQNEKDVSHAAETLINLALDKEQQAWNKKIELSLGKLALLAESEQRKQMPNLFKSDADEARIEKQISKINDELTSIRIQDQLYEQVHGSTYGAVDQAAALNFAMEAHSANVPRRQKALRQLFEDGMERLLKHEALDAMTLIDLLTLVELKPEAKDDIVNPFWLALKVATSSCHGDEVKEAKRLIWRRLFLRDDWAKINDTQLKDDREVVERLVDTELFNMLAECIRFQNVREGFQPMMPNDALGAFTEHLDRRFRDFETGTQKKILEAMSYEDKLLKQNIEKHRLAEWLRTTFEAAQLQIETIEAENNEPIPAEQQSPLFNHDRVTPNGSNTIADGPGAELFGRA